MVKAKRLFCKNLRKLGMLQEDVNCYTETSELKTDNR